MKRQSTRRADASTELVRAWKDWTAGAPRTPTASPAALPQYAGLTSAQELTERQRLVDADIDAAARRSSLAGLTLRTALRDVSDVVVGLPADLLSGGTEVPLSVVTRGDRLRGLGLLLVAMAVVIAVL